MRAKAPAVPQATVVNVFCHEGQGGNPMPVVPDADPMEAPEMLALARRYGLECSFVFPPDPGDDEADFRFRFFVPRHEMDMCGHGTIGGLWLLGKRGDIGAGSYRVRTACGLIGARVGPTVEITQPKGRVDALDATDQVLAVLGLKPGDMADYPVQNACTSRVKTLVPLESPAALNALEPAFGKIKALCDRIGSTGLYPYAAISAVDGIFEARQFPRDSGYPEDAATGIAASALAFALLETGHADPDAGITVLQGRRMGRLSAIRVGFRRDGGAVEGCWLSGQVALDHRGS